MSDTDLQQLDSGERFYRLVLADVNDMASDEQADSLRATPSKRRSTRPRFPGEEPTVTAAERFEHMVAMAMQAWDATFPNRERYLASGYLALERRRFERAVRERLAQSAQVYELEIGAVAAAEPCGPCNAHPDDPGFFDPHTCGRNRELVRENEVLRSNSDHLSSENASLASQVESMAMRIESLAEELAKPEDVRLREVLDALDGRAVIFDGLGERVGHLLDEMDEWIERAGEAERLAEERLAHVNQMQATMANVVPADVHEHGWQWRPTGKDTAFAPPFGTIRVCGACGCLVAGGPAACARCAEAGT